jgi:hypothetical protein
MCAKTYLFLATTIGDGLSGTVGSPSEEIESFNETLTDIGTYVGAIIVVASIIKLILAFTSEQPNEKQRAAAMFGIGITLMSLSVIIDTLTLTETTTARDVLFDAIEILGHAASYVGVILVLYGIYEYIKSILDENALAKATGTEMTAIGIALMGITNTLTSIASSLFSRGKSGSGMLDSTMAAGIMVKKVTSLLADISTYVGAFLLCRSVFGLIYCFREEDASGKSKYAVGIGVSVALLSMKLVYKAIGFESFTY